MLWDGHRREVVLQINNIKLQKVNGVDSDNDGKADWIDAYLAKKENVIKLGESRTSPANIEGTSKYAELIRINGGSVSVQAADNIWFADVNLNPAEKTPVEISFQNGGRLVSGTIDWCETNLISENGQTITIRKNDSLKLNVYPEGSQSGSWFLKGLGAEWTGNITEPKVLKFTTAGEFVIEGEYFAENQQTGITGEIKVRVVEYEFTEAAPAFWINRLRSWDTANCPAGVTLQPTKGITLFEQSSTLADGQVRYRMGVNDEGNPGVFARIEKDGPILALAKIKPFQVYSSSETYAAQAEGYDDGTGLYEMPLIASPVLPDIEIRLRIFVAGVLFENGTTEMRVHAEDFDERGMMIVKFLKHPDATTSICHTLQVYQNNMYVGIRH